MKVDIKLRKPITIELQARRTLDGNILIFDHIDMDMAIMPDKRKVLTYPKEEMSDDVYISQSRLFEFLVRSGVVAVDSIRGSNIYGSLEGRIVSPKNEDIEPINATLFSIHQFLKEEASYFEAVKTQKETMLQWYTDPDADESTELGKIPHAKRKGSMNSVRPYMKNFYGHWI